MSQQRSLVLQLRYGASRRGINATTYEPTRSHVRKCSAASASGGPGERAAAATHRGQRPRGGLGASVSADPQAGHVCLILAIQGVSLSLYFFIKKVGRVFASLEDT